MQSLQLQLEDALACGNSSKVSSLATSLLKAAGRVAQENYPSLASTTSSNESSATKFRDTPTPRERYFKYKKAALAALDTLTPNAKARARAGTRKRSRSLSQSCSSVSASKNFPANCFATNNLANITLIGSNVY